MTLTKTDMIKDVSKRVRQERLGKENQQFLFPEFRYKNLPIERAADLVNTLFEIMIKTLEKGDPIKITGFGQFLVKFKWARKGRNPQTGEPMILDSRRVVRFRYSRKLKEEINRPDKE